MYRLMVYRDKECFRFPDLVLLHDPDEPVVIEGLELLAPPAGEPDQAAIRERQRRLAQRRGLIAEFPFDVINLDLEGFFFRAGDPFPGKLVNALRKILNWQKATSRMDEGASGTA